MRSGVERILTVNDGVFFAGDWPASFGRALAAAIYFRRGFVTASSLLIRTNDSAKYRDQNGQHHHYSHNDRKRNGDRETNKSFHNGHNPTP